MTPAVLISLVVGSAIPGVTALITKKTASKTLRAIMTALLSVVNGATSLVVFVPVHGVGQWEQFLAASFAAWVASSAAYAAAWKPTGAAQKITDKTANFGFGPKNTVG